MEQTLVTIHNIIRWIVLLVGVAGLLRTILAMRTVPVWMGMDRGLSAGYAGFIDLQILAGIALMIVILTGPARTLTLSLIAHPVVMLIAAGVAHMNRRYRAAPDAEKFRGQLVLYLVSLALIVIGIQIAPNII